jgi:hypothetical protein
MAKGSSGGGRSSGGTHTGSNGRSYPNTGASPARQSQPSGTTVGGYTKVANPDGTYRMKPSK